MLSIHTLKRLGELVEQLPSGFIEQFNKSVMGEIRHEIQVRENVRPVAFLEDFASWDLDDLAAEVAGFISKTLSHTWDDAGIGPFEFWGQRGVDTREFAVVKEVSRWVEFGSDFLLVPMIVSGSYQGGGCPGEDAPKHTCGRECQEVELSFKAVAYRMIPGPGHNGSFLVEYSIEPDG